MSLVTARCAGLVQPPDGPVADPGVSEGGHAGPGFHLTVHCVVVVVVVVVEVYPEELVVQADALVGGPAVRDVLGCQLHGLLGQGFLQLQQISIFKSQKKPQRISQFLIRQQVISHREPQEEALRSVISAFPCAQLPVKKRRS